MRAFDPLWGSDPEPVSYFEWWDTCQILVLMKHFISMFLGNKNHPRVLLVAMKAVPCEKAAYTPTLCLFGPATIHNKSFCGHTTTAGRTGKSTKLNFFFLLLLFKSTIIQVALITLFLLLGYDCHSCITREWFITGLTSPRMGLTLCLVRSWIAEFCHLEGAGCSQCE